MIGLTMIEIGHLDPHPDNPRSTIRTDVITGMVAGIRERGELAERYALTVRKIDDRYQILAGHHRRLAALEAGLTEVPAFVVEMDDAAAFMELARSNTHGELTALERGRHALGSGMDGKSYAASVGRPQQTVAREVCAARVAQSVPIDGCGDLSPFTTHLSEIHGAPSWLWPALVARLVAEGWTVEVTRKNVKRLTGIEAPPTWADGPAIADLLVDGGMQPSELAKMVATLTAPGLDDDIARLMMSGIDSGPSRPKPSRLSEVIRLRQEAEAVQVERRRAADAAANEALATVERAAVRTRKLRANVSLEEWGKLDEPEREALMAFDDADRADAPTFNRQENDSIEWAQWSWNPVTGCQHTCPYCYARDIATSTRMAAAYPHGFAPAFRPRMLGAPAATKVPKEAAVDTRYRNVFTCSMADLFGRWVPSEWIDAVLDAVSLAPQWNFLMLTKFPKRLAEFELPNNAWMGTTVDLQARVDAAEAAFAQIENGVRWLSLEPMLEPLKFKRPELFQWVVIGGSSRSSATPEWHPPFPWIEDVVKQFRDVGAKIYFKTNLLGSRLLELPFDAPLNGDPTDAPAVFRYLSKDKSKKRTAALDLD